MSSFARLAARTLVVGFGVAALIGQLRLYSAPGADEVDAGLRFVAGANQRGGARQMQALFPEGYLFSYALYGLAWIERGLGVAADHPLRARAAHEARAALARIESAEGRAPFPAAQSPRHGIFYAGWTNWLRGGVLLLARDGGDRERELRAFAQRCDEIARAFARSETPFLQAYPGSAWPVDSVVAIASLRVHDALGPPRYAGVITTWLARVRQRLDPGTGLLPHRVDPASGQPLETARGSSQSVLLRFLLEIDPAWAHAQYRRFRDAFVTTRLGLPGVREYPIGKDGTGDVDSGPLLAGVSMSATVVTRGAARVHGDDELAGALAQTMELFGAAISFAGERCYAFGVLPVGDAFIAWSHGARAWTAPANPAPLPRRLSPLWRWPTHLIAAVVVGPLLWAAFRRRRGGGR